jgi:DNA-binding transcriptional ArsR family regulator
VTDGEGSGRRQGAAAEPRAASGRDRARPRGAALLKALASEPRLHVLCRLLEGPLSVGEINAGVPLSQSALSQHLAVLREAGIVSTRRESQAIYYSLVTGPAHAIMAALYAAYCAPAGRTGRARRR